ncbi:hypothetical protein MBCUR_10320 [Methanobrevibacter curvatus]|uniref:DUF63 family protein n=2 Tax=Methanobrevibacter curvatus TaxID=49547 RepID=A0A166AW41_9EURY|nr:hypothetical protein MBCUR_10320 [Methanobrevibacter curvatus]
MDFFEKYFFSGYNIFNTLVYGILLIIAIFILIQFFKKIDKRPEKLIVAVIPFILMGSITRALVDNGIFEYSWFLITPGIYYIIGGLTIISLLLGLLIEKKIFNKINKTNKEIIETNNIKKNIKKNLKNNLENKLKNNIKKSFKTKIRKNIKNKIDYRLIIFSLGLLGLIYVSINIHQLNFKVIVEVLLIWLILTGIFYILGKKIKIYRDKYNLSIISAHLLDATTTFIAVDFYGYIEQHVLPNLIYSEFSTATSIYPLKIIVISLAIYSIDKYIDDKTIKGLLKLAIFILGLAPAIRNLFTMAIGIQ